MAGRMDRLIDAGEKLGLKGEDLAAFVSQQQAIEREERKLEHEERRRQEEAQRASAEDERREEARRRHEMEMMRLELEASAHGVRISEGGARGLNPKVPKLPVFADGTDELDNYLRRFERFATNSGWKETERVSYLSTLLTGRALDVYSRLPDSATDVYKQLKQALLKRYNLTHEGYRLKFRQERPERDESPSQFIARLLNYVKKWMSLAEVAGTGA